MPGDAFPQTREELDALMEQPRLQADIAKAKVIVAGTRARVARNFSLDIDNQPEGLH